MIGEMIEVVIGDDDWDGWIRGNGVVNCDDVNRVIIMLLEWIVEEILMSFGIEEIYVAWVLEILL